MKGCNHFSRVIHIFLSLRCEAFLPIPGLLPVSGTVRQLLHERIRDAYIHPQFISDVMKPLMIEEIIDQEVQNLSGKHARLIL